MMLELSRLLKLFKVASLWTKSLQPTTGSLTKPLPNSTLKMLLGLIRSFFSLGPVVAAQQIHH